MEFLSAPHVRRASRRLRLGPVAIGGAAPVTVQTMASAPTADVRAASAQAAALARAGAAVVRLGVPDMAAARAVAAVRRACPAPVVADIHFDHRLALACLDGGVDGLRLNPGNIRRESHVAAVLAAAAARGVPVRVGVNGGSLPADLLAAHGGVTPEALAEAARRECALFERHGFRDYKVSIKCSSVVTTLEANRLFAASSDAPLHLGVTEAGVPECGMIRTAVGVGRLLAAGIGDTIRVSLTADPLIEVAAGYALLAALGIPAWRPPWAEPAA